MVIDEESGKRLEKESYELERIDRQNYEQNYPRPNLKFTIDLKAYKTPYPETTNITW